MIPVRTDVPRHFRSSLTNWLVAPTAALLIAAVVVNVGFTAWWASWRSMAAAREREHQVAAVLKYARVSPSIPVLRAIHQRTGDDLLVWDGPPGVAGLSTLPPERLDHAALKSGIVSGEAILGATRYRVGVVRLAGERPTTLLVLAPVRPFAATLEVVWPMLAMAAATLVLLVPIGIRTTRRLASSLGEIDRHVARIAEGDFGDLLPEKPDGADPDEIRRLVAGVNRMSSTLANLEASLVAGERQRLLGQLAAGFAHELRNAITGAGLAIDLHRRRCPLPADPIDRDESLVVAKRQLEILEEEVRGLLALGRPTDARPEPFAVDSLFAEVRQLVAPRCEHAGVRMASEAPAGITLTGRRETLRAALVNLALNGIDAAGPGGSVRMQSTFADGGVILSVADTGPGPPEAIRDTIHEPFVTGKPEGIGLGLAVATAVAEMHGGVLQWRRKDGETLFEITLPATTLVAESQCPTGDAS